MASEVEAIEAALLKCGTPVYDLTKPGRHVLVDVAEAAAAIAALRAQDREGAREMWERAFGACDSRRERNPDADAYDSGFRMGCAACADDIAALPFSPVRMENGRDA